jgi:hypothetical protein
MTKPSMELQPDGHPQEETAAVRLPGFAALTGGQAIMYGTALCAIAWAIARHIFFELFNLSLYDYV